MPIVATKLETIKISTNRWMNKQTVVYPYSGIPVSDRQELTIDTCYNMDESQNNHAKWKQADKKRVNTIWYY